ncbi:MAG: BtrH N-terminal domain-containing protein [Opitutaceae bacterium]|nr:BtrH N-terminal domain-containing protein [Opitutaceae bacterium]
MNTTIATSSAAPAASTFQHLQSAHCESGVITSLLRHEGLPITEAMVFGLTSALSFCYFPFVKINQLPLISYRMTPRYILNGIRRLLRVPLRYETFRAPADGTRRLDELLARGRPVGLQGSVYFLPYFPVNMRFHFNAHNLIAYGRDSATGEYLISDPVFNTPTRSAPDAFERARFVRGALAPRGLIYHIDGAIPDKDIAQVVPLLRAAIRKNAFMMLWMPIPCVGTPGIRLLASRVRRLPAQKQPDFCRRFAGHIVRMQEEVGTGGAGFRFLYAAFLQEAAVLLNKPALHELSLELTAIGDEWRVFATHAARQNKGRAPLDPPALAATLATLSAKERLFFKKLWKAV